MTVDNSDPDDGWAKEAAKIYGGPSPFDAGPMWCFDRMGQSQTVLPDGRVVRIAAIVEGKLAPERLLALQRHTLGWMEQIEAGSCEIESPATLKRAAPGP